jgi:hypothetical protein
VYALTTLDQVNGLVNYRCEAQGASRLQHFGPQQAHTRGVTGCHCEVQAAFGPAGELHALQERA